MAYYNPPALGAPNRAIDHFSTARAGPARAKDTTYTNTSAYALFVVVQFNHAGASSGTLVIAGTTIGVLSHSDAGVASYIVSFIVPPGATYRINGSGAAFTTAATWSEWTL